MQNKIKQIRNNLLCPDSYWNLHPHPYRSLYPNLYKLKEELDSNNINKLYFNSNSFHLIRNTIKNKRN